MDDYISISSLNDFIFCPYSIYLHNVYMETDEDNYHATPQTRGKVAHQSIDNKASSEKWSDTA
jgi:CRISPR-associated protein Cas4